MKLRKTEIEGLYIIEFEPLIDERGNFTRVFCRKELAKFGIDFNMVQINQSATLRKGTIRGMHFQTSPKSEAKIIQCLEGAIYDVAIDLRNSSPTYGHWVAQEFTKDSKEAFFIPHGFAHGFQSLTDNCVVQYLMSEFYTPDCATGVRWDDPLFNIDWPIQNPTLSEKDKNWSRLE